MFKRKPKQQPRQVTPTATPPGGVFSYHSNRSQSERISGRTEQHRDRRAPRFDFRNVPTWLAIIIIIGSCLYALTLTSNAKVEITSEGSVTLARDTATYQSAVDDIISQSAFSYTKLTINTESIATQLQQQFPEIESVAVSIPLLGHRPAVAIQTAQPAFLLASTRSGAYYIDAEGRVMVKAGDIPSESVKGVVTVRDDSGIEAVPNKQLLPKDTVSFIATIINQLKAKNIPIEALILPTKPYEVQLRIQGAPYLVRFSTEEDSRQQIGTYLAVKDKLAEQGTTPAEYIDVRVGERAYYK